MFASVFNAAILNSFSSGELLVTVWKCFLLRVSLRRKFCSGLEILVSGLVVAMLDSFSSGELLIKVWKCFFESFFALKVLLRS